MPLLSQRPQKSGPCGLKTQRPGQKIKLTPSNYAPKPQSEGLGRSPMMVGCPSGSRVSKRKHTPNRRSASPQASQGLPNLPGLLKKPMSGQNPRCLLTCRATSPVSEGQSHVAHQSLGLLTQEGAGYKDVSCC